MVTYCWNATVFVCRQLPGYNVFEGMTNNQYNEFYQQLRKAADIANRAYYTEKVTKVVELWRELFGEQFGNF